jgi:7,8-dihydroneopterin aldolase/epimerase/oxygenase
MLAPRDQIVISQLEISTFIGATDEEQKRPQRLRVSLVLEPKRGLAGLGDDLSQTIDYAEVSQTVKSLAVLEKRRLIETLAEDIACLLLKTYPIAAVEVELRKYILPDTKFVAVRIRRE